MALTSSAFVVLVAVLAVAAFVGAVVLWPRAAGTGLPAYAARVGVLVAVSTCVMLLVGTLVNDANGLYADWADLLGAAGVGHAQKTAVHGGPALAATARQAPGTAWHGSYPSNPALPAGATATPLLGGQVFRAMVTGPVSGVTSEVDVWVPASYAAPSSASTRYPVIEAFHGVPGTPEQWTVSMDLPGALRTAVAGREIAESVVVSPRLDVPPGVDNECVDGGPGRPQMETWLTQDLPEWVAQHFRVQHRRQGWATMGLSAGGWCAAMTAMLHPDRYAAAVVLGGYFRPLFPPGQAPFSPTSPAGRRLDLVALARRAPPPVALWLETSHRDHVSYTSSHELLQVAHRPLAVQSLVLSHAGHRVSLWKALVPSTLTWLGRSVPGFRAP